MVENEYSDGAKKFDEMLARARRSRYGHNSNLLIYSLTGRVPQKDGMELLADIGREQMEKAKVRYGKNWKKVPLKEIFEL